MERNNIPSMNSALPCWEKWLQGVLMRQRFFRYPEQKFVLFARKVSYRCLERVKCILFWINKYSIHSSNSRGLGWKQEVFSESWRQESNCRALPFLLPGQPVHQALGTLASSVLQTIHQVIFCFKVFPFTESSTWKTLPPQLFWRLITLILQVSAQKSRCFPWLSYLK